MRSPTPLLALALLAAPLAAQEPGELRQVTGCENGELVLPILNLFAGPPPARVMGKLSGTSRTDRCHGAFVNVLATQPGGRWVQVETVVRGDVGWISRLLIGRRVDRSRCEAEFTDPEHLRRCRGG